MRCQGRRAVRFIGAAVLALGIVTGAHGAAPPQAGAHPTSTPPNASMGPVEFQVTRSAGLLPAVSVSVDTDGQVRATGSARLQNPTLVLPSAARAGLLTLAKAEHF